ncbi:MAG: L-threonylcarbamoyladenylate synthase [Bacillota bacterium]
MPETTVWRVDGSRPDNVVLSKAGALIARGRLVAFPTETVYGIGVNALDEAAVRALFAAKGRPADNPLILHLAAPEDVTAYVGEVTALAAGLMEAFWPGPLTLVFRGAGRLPRMVTGGLETIAVRVPAHPVALGIIRAAGVPVVAPSANASGRPSPTTAAHVMADMAGKIDAVVDGGPTFVGIESTILDVSGDVPKILRHGAVSVGEIAAVCGMSLQEEFLRKEQKPTSLSRARLILVEGTPGSVTDAIVRLHASFTADGNDVAVLAREERVGLYPGVVAACGSSTDSRSVAAALYAALRQLENADVILVEGVAGEMGAAVRQRLHEFASQVVRAEGGS